MMRSSEIINPVSCLHGNAVAGGSSKNFRAYEPKPLRRVMYGSTSLTLIDFSIRNSHGPLQKLCVLRLRGERDMRCECSYKDKFFSFRYPVLSDKPEWWWRTLACVPYLIALQISDAGYYIHPFTERYEFFGDVIYFIPGAITRLPAWFSMVYCYFAYIGIVKNKDWPHFFRFHLMMGMLLETALQVMWYSSNFVPLIHYAGTLGLYYWAGVGLAYVLLLLHCIRSALAGRYVRVPYVSDAAYIHTLFNIGGYQRPF